MNIHVRLSDAERNQALIWEAIAMLPSEAALAKAAGVSRTLINATKRTGKVGRRLAEGIDAATGGRITKHALRPDLFDADGQRLTTVGADAPDWMMDRRKKQRERHRAILEAYRLGEPIDSIAERFGVTRTYPAVLALRANIPRRKPHKWGATTTVTQVVERDGYDTVLAELAALMRLTAAKDEHYNIEWHKLADDLCEAAKQASDLQGTLPPASFITTPIAN